MLILSPIGQRLLVRRASKMLQDVLAGKVELQGARTDFWSHIELYGLSVIDTVGSGGMISVGHAQVTYFLPALLRKRLAIRSIKLDRVVVDLQRTRKGGFPLLGRRSRTTVGVSKKDTSRASKSQIRFTLKSVRIRDARLRYRDEGLLIDVGLADVEAEIRFVRLDSMLLRVKSGQGYVNTPWWNGLIDKVAAEGRLGPEGLRLKEASLSGPTVEIQGRGSIPFHVEGPWNLVAHARSTVSSVTVLSRTLPALGREGTLEAEAEWRGPLSRPILKLNLLGERIKWTGIALDSLSLQARYLGDHVLRALLRLRGPILNAEIREKATIPNLLRHPRLRNYEVECRLDSLSYEWLRSRFGIPTKTKGGVVSGQGWARGFGLRNWPEELRVTASLDGWKGPDSSTTPVLTDLSVQSGRWRLQLFWAANALRGAGVLVGRSSVDGEVVADLGELVVPARYFLDEELGGRLQARLKIVGPLKRPAFWFQTTGKDLFWHGLVVDSLWALGDSRGERLRISNSLVTLRTNLAQLGKRLSVPDLAGQLRARLRARGLVPHLRALGDVTASNLRYAHWRCDTLAGTVAFSGDTLSWKRLLLRKDTSIVGSRGLLVARKRRLEGQGDFRFALRDSSQQLPGGVAHGEFVLTADSFRVFLSGQSLDLAGLRAWVPFTTDLVGTGDVVASLKGPPDNPRGLASVSFHGAGWGRWRVSTLKAVAALQDSLLESRGMIALAESSSAIHFDLFCPLLPKGKWAVDTAAARIFVANIRGDSIELKDVGPFLPKGVRLRGRSSLRLALRRAGLAWVVSGKAGLTNCVLKLNRPGVELRKIEGDVEVAGALPRPAARVRLTAGKGVVAGQRLDSLLLELALDSQDSLKIPRFTVWAEGGNLTLSGGIPGILSQEALGFDGRMEMRAFPIAFANAYTGPVRIRKGTLSGDIDLTVAPGGRFRSDGSMELRSVHLRVGDLRPDITNLHLRLALGRDSVFVRTLGGRWGSGEFAGRGFVALGNGGLTAADLQLSGNELSFSLPDVAEVHISELQTRLASRPGGGRFTLSGKITLGESRFVRDLRLGDLVSALRGASPRPRRPTPFLQNLDLDVALIVPQSLVVDVNLGKMRLDGQLALSQKAVQPAVTGEFRVVDGYIFYLDRKFEIEEATFRQLEPFRINPEINFRAVAEVRPVQATEGPATYRITLLLTGNLEHPELTLQSEPPLSQADIVSLLTIGRVRSGAGAVAGDQALGIGQILVQRAKSITSQQVTGLAARQMERLLRLESVTIEGNLFETNQIWGPRVTITKRLAERLNLTYQTVVGHTNEQRIRISYRINPYLYLDGETDELGRAGIDLIARFRFK